MTESESRAIFWHRRDLRIHDNASLFLALKENDSVLPVFVFDSEILKNLPSNDQRIVFIHREIHELKKQYRALGTDLVVLVGNPLRLIPELCRDFNAGTLYTNRDYEPEALKRDAGIFAVLEKEKIAFKAKKDQVIFDRKEVVKNDGLPYTVFTPYMRKWKEKLSSFYLKSYPVEKYTGNLFKPDGSGFVFAPEIPTLQEMSFEGIQTQVFPAGKLNEAQIRTYEEQRDFPALDATSRLSLHLRFGTISIRSLVTTALKINEKFLNELIWRDFYQAILYHFPDSALSSFKKNYDRIQWINDEFQFKAWSEGMTGYPLVDAGMRELNQTGFMHNRVRMVTASFLCKHLLIDWRWGERYFAEKLLDFELASNVGGWQWASGSGCDAAPYFRVFSPQLQQEKFDPDFVYIKKWLPEFGTEAYPRPIVVHTFARERAIRVYKSALSGLE